MLPDCLLIFGKSSLLVSNAACSHAQLPSGSGNRWERILHSEDIHREVGKESGSRGIADEGESEVDLGSAGYDEEL